MHQRGGKEQSGILHAPSKSHDGDELSSGLVAAGFQAARKAVSPGDMGMLLPFRDRSGKRTTKMWNEILHLI
ncbi:hypothetical protein TURU_105676 [Turdus rufiventris]|nr:hypothetical protein TURU_105676 [Turdus rufiventris]